PGTTSDLALGVQMTLRRAGLLSGPATDGPRDATNIRGPWQRRGVALVAGVIVPPLGGRCSSPETRTRRVSLTCLRGPGTSLLAPRLAPAISDWSLREVPA